MDELYIWISRWRDFQHYAPERDRAPAWIKTYTKQLDDDDYLALSSDQRAVLHDLRSAFARSHGKLSSDTRRLSHRLGVRVTSSTLERLNHAGFIDIVSRETLEQRLEQLYSKSSPHARPRARREGEVEVEKEDQEQDQNPPSVRTAEASYADRNGRPDGSEQEIEPDIDFENILRSMPE